VPYLPFLKGAYHVYHRNFNSFPTAVELPLRPAACLPGIMSHGAAKGKLNPQILDWPIIFNKGKAFLFWARFGGSEVPAGVFEGDLIIRGMHKDTLNSSNLLCHKKFFHISPPKF